MIINQYLKPQIEQPIDCKYFISMLYLFMSQENLQVNLNEIKPKERKNHKVDINLLMDRVREEKKKEKKENIIFIMDQLNKLIGTET